MPMQVREPLLSVLRISPDFRPAWRTPSPPPLLRSVPLAGTLGRWGRSARRGHGPGAVPAFGPVEEPESLRACLNRGKLRGSTVTHHEISQSCILS